MQPSADQSHDRRVTVIEAAAILGITPDAVRSRLRRGTLRRDEAEDGTVLVVLEGVAEDGRDGRDQHPTNLSTDHTTVGYINGLNSQIELLERELAAWKAEAADWKEAARRKDHLLAAALERIPALEEPTSEPPPDARESPVTASEEPSRGEGREEPEKPQKRSWWRRLFE